MSSEIFIESITKLLAMSASLVAIYKVVLDLSKEKTKRSEIEAKENSLGREAVLLLKDEISKLKDEISKLKESGGKYELKIQTLDSAMHSLQFICNMIEGRMMQMFPDRKPIN